MRDFDAIAAFALATGIHLGAFAMMPAEDSTGVAANTATMRVSAAVPELEALARKWEEAPTMVDTVSAPQATETSAPMPAPAAPSAPNVLPGPASMADVAAETLPKAETAPLARVPVPALPNLTLPDVQGSVIADAALPMPHAPRADFAALSAPEEDAPVLKRYAPTGLSPQRAQPEPAQPKVAPARLDAPKGRVPVPDRIAAPPEPLLARPPVSEPLPNASAPPERLDARKVSLRPILRPEHFARLAPKPAKPARVAKQARAAQRGAPATAPAKSRAKVAASAQVPTSKLMNAWRSKIYSKIQRNVVPPRGQQSARATRLLITLGPDGRVRKTALAATSGNARIDRAALSAVRRAGRFPRAPKGLNKPSYTFKLSLRITP